MSVKSSNSISDSSGEVVKSGYLKKLKTMRKKFFVLRAETLDSSARLEYYDSEKKFKSQQSPKRSISLKACFNINKRVDTKHKHVIALYTKDDCFCIVLENEKELDDWLKTLLSLQHGEDVVDGEPIKPTFEHVWQVTMLNKGLGSSRNILGAYHLCFTDKTLSLVRKSTTSVHGITADHVEFSLMSVRRCGHSECFFYMEVGRSAVTGAGELWMQTEDTNIAQNIGEVILRAMSNNNKEDLGPKARIRSSSANEASKPILVQRRQTHSGQKSYCSPSQGMGGRERCDSMPSRCRTTSEGTPNNCMTAPVAVIHPMHRPHHSIHSHSHLIAPHHRPQSLYTGQGGHSPPHHVTGSPVSPASASATDSAGSSLSIDDGPDAWSEYVESSLGRYGLSEETNLGRYSHSLTPDEPIAEENPDEGTDNCYVAVSPTGGSPPLNGGYVPMAPLSSDDGYVDMSPRGRNMSPAASTSSITSGTPSTDLRFSEYHLEKVSSYFTPSEEDDTSSAERPMRAYSVGSRPDTFKLRKNDSGINSRVRAFSVGSRSKGVHNRILPPHSHNHTGNKSSSAPLLSGSNSHLGSQNSVERMEDLMELDFSKKGTEIKPETGYVDMSSPRSRTVSGSNVTAPAGYVEMKPGIADCNSPDISYIDMKPVSPEHPYLDMRPATSPLKPANSPYLEMSPNTKYNPYYVEMSGSSKFSSSPKNQNIPKTTSPIQEEYLEMDFKQSKQQNRTLSGAARTQPVDLPIKKQSHDGYMDMSWSTNKHQRKSSLDSAKVNVNNNNNNNINDDYMNMSGRKKEKKASKKDKTRSQPITIQQPSTSTSNFASFLQNRKNTPPKNLPLHSCNYSPSNSPFSSLRRPRSRKNSRRDSTPTNNEPTIFPFSPGSPIKPFNLKTPEINNQNSKLSGKPPTGDYQKMSFDFSQKTDADYTEMNFDSSEEAYVNYNPPKRTNTEDYGEYAVMRPIQIVQSVKKIANNPNITKQLSSLSFRPISEPKDDCRLGAVSPKPGDIAPQPENLQTDPSQIETAETTTNLENSKPQLSRPSSVSSELGSTSSTLVGDSRPGSVCSDQKVELHYASLDLAPVDDDTNKSPRSGRVQETRSPTPNSGGTTEGFTYAEIDFIKSETFKNKIK